MPTRDISQYYDQPCKFTLNCGKEVYGVVWEVLSDGKRECYFASSGAYEHIAATNLLDSASSSPSSTLVDIDNFIDAEYLEKEITI